MQYSQKPQNPTDPVCGSSVNPASPYHCVHGGAIFCFCSESCQARFDADANQFVSLRPARAQSPLVVQAVTHPVPSPVPVPVKKPPQVEDRDDDLAARSEFPEFDDSRIAVDAEHRQKLGGWRGALASHFLAWREGRHAARASRDLLKIYRTLSADHPELHGRDLYRQVVMSRSRCDAQAADTILDSAESSFASWPVHRELTLCDVVHYLSMQEFLAANEGEPWIHADIRGVVTSQLPHDLCVVRRPG